MTITRAEYMRRTTQPAPATVVPHRPGLAEHVGPVIPAPCGPPPADDTLVMVRLRADALAVSWALREDTT